MRLAIAFMAAALLSVAANDRALAAAGPVIDWDPAYGWQTGATPFNLPAAGEFKMVGIISDFGPPLDDLDAANPATEYTFYVHGLISNGTTFVGPLGTRFYTTTFSGGTIEVYYDTTPESSFDPNPPNAGVPADFIDGGAPILTGSFTSFVVQTNDFTAFQTGNIEGDFNWTGGTLLYRLPTNGGEPCPGLFTGGMTWNTSVGIPGYLFRHDGKIDLQCPTSVQNSTWGQLKALYR